MSLKNLPRPFATLLIVILSIVLISAGSATAAKLISGKDIKNNSVTGKDIKSNSLRPADLSGAAKKTLTGPAGPAGPAVLTDIYSFRLDIEGLAADTPEIVLSRTLPSGKPYLFTAKLNLVTVGVGEHLCELLSGPDVLDTAVINTTTATSKNVLALTSVTPSSGLVRLRCTIDGGPGSVQQVKLTALPLQQIMPDV